MLLLIPLVGYALVPEGNFRQFLYAFAGLLCISSAAFWGLLRNGHLDRPAGCWCSGGFLGWVLGDWMYLVEQNRVRGHRLPGPLGRGLHRVVRR